MEGPTASVLINQGLSVSTHAFVETLAHELYGHGIILREAARERLDLGHLMENEAFSLAVGAVCALESGDSVMKEDLLDALSRSTSAYYAGFLFSDSAAQRLQLSLAEAGDPDAAIAARLDELARRRRHVALRSRDMAVWRWRLDHFERAHGADPRAAPAARVERQGR